MPDEPSESWWTPRVVMALMAAVGFFAVLFAPGLLPWPSKESVASLDKRVEQIEQRRWHVDEQITTLHTRLLRLQDHLDEAEDDIASLEHNQNRVLQKLGLARERPGSPRRSK